MSAGSGVNRLQSIDVLRGWTVAAMVLVNGAGDWNHVYPWLEHSAWHGCSPADIIFPLFLFLVGAGLALSLPSAQPVGAHSPQLLQAGWRSLRMIALGLLLNWIASLSIDGRDFRIPGVLQRIGLCYLLGVLWLQYFRTPLWRWISMLMLGLLYGLLLLGGGSLAPDQNVADRLDRFLFGHYAYRYDPLSGLASDPEGLLSTCGALLNLMWGVLVTGWLRQAKRSQIAVLALAGMVLALALDHYLPFNKALWTPSFALWTSAAASVLLLVLNQVFDRWQWRPYGRSLGRNAIVVYAASWLLSCWLAWSGAGGWLYLGLENWLLPTFSAEFASALFAAWQVLVFAWLAYLMDRRGWRIVI